MKWLAGVSEMTDCEKIAADHELKHKATTSKAGDVIIIPISTTMQFVVRQYKHA